MMDLVADKNKAPRFNIFRPISERSSTVMSKNRSKNTTAELLLRRELWCRGYRYRIHVNNMIGKPDIVSKKKQVAIFIDGDFWHGRNWEERKAKLQRGSNSKYWIDKIQYNMKRDINVTKELENKGWKVIRLWETDILKDVEKNVIKIINVSK